MFIVEFGLYFNQSLKRTIKVLLLEMMSLLFRLKQSRDLNNMFLILFLMRNQLKLNFIIFYFLIRYLGRDFWRHKKIGAVCNWWVQCMRICLWPDRIWKNLHVGRHEGEPRYNWKEHRRNFLFARTYKAIFHNKHHNTYGRNLHGHAHRFALPKRK